MKPEELRLLSRQTLPRQTLSRQTLSRQTPAKNPAPGGKSRFPSLRPEASFKPSVSVARTMSSMRAAVRWKKVSHLSQPPSATLRPSQQEPSRREPSKRQPSGRESSQQGARFERFARRVAPPRPSRFGAALSPGLTEAREEPAPLPPPAFALKAGDKAFCPGQGGGSGDSH